MLKKSKPKMVFDFFIGDNNLIFNVFLTISPYTVFFGHDTIDVML